MKLNRSTLLLIFLFLSVAVWSQGVQRKVRFMVTDLHDGYPLTDYTATLMTADSTVIKTAVKPLRILLNFIIIFPPKSFF